MNSIENPGKSSPLGASVNELGVNFSLYSRDATDVDLLLFDREEDATPACVIPIDPAANHTYHYWHAFVPGVIPGQLYAYRVKGPAEAAHDPHHSTSMAELSAGAWIPDQERG